MDKFVLRWQVLERLAEDLLRAEQKRCGQPDHGRGPFASISVTSRVLDK
jgi:hypothetical protein